MVQINIINCYTIYNISWEYLGSSEHYTTDSVEIIVRVIVGVSFESNNSNYDSCCSRTYFSVY